MFTNRVSQGSLFNTSLAGPLQIQPDSLSPPYTHPVSPGTLRARPAGSTLPPSPPTSQNPQAGPRPPGPPDTPSARQPACTPDLCGAGSSPRPLGAPAALLRGPGLPGPWSRTHSRAAAPSIPAAPLPARRGPADGARGAPEPRPARPARTAGEELGRQLPDELGDPLPLALGAAALDLRLQPRARLPGRHRGLAGPGRPPAGPAGPAAARAPPPPPPAAAAGSGCGSRLRGVTGAPAEDGAGGARRRGPGRLEERPLPARAGAAAQAGAGAGPPGAGRGPGKARGVRKGRERDPVRGRGWGPACGWRGLQEGGMRERERGGRGREGGGIGSVKRR